MKKSKILSRIAATILSAVMLATLLPGSVSGLSGSGNLSKVEAASVRNPRIVKDSTMDAGQRVTWDCVWFGSYPQTEVVSKKNKKQIAALKKMNKYYKTDYKTVSAKKFAKIKNAKYSNGDAKVGSERYRRIKYSDATTADSGFFKYYDWNGDKKSYHYFKYEKIKWRVLNVKNGKAFLFADVALDDQQYNIKNTNITWEKSTIRSFLNSYGSSANMVGKNYASKGFLNNAFSSKERSAIQTASLTNADSLYFGIEGGKNTSDKIFLLSESDVWATDTAASYGFVKDTEGDEARWSKVSTYAFAMGTERVYGSDCKGNCSWWLRSPGDYSADCAARVTSSGYRSYWGADVGAEGVAVRPALYLNLSAIKQYSLAGTVCSNGKVNEKTAQSSKSKKGKKEKTVKVRSIRLSGISHKIAAGKKIKLTKKITPQKVSKKKLKWTSSNKKVATVNKKGVVRMKKNSGGKSVTITARATDGSGKKATYRIKSMKGVVKKVTIKGKKSVKAGKKLKLKAKVKATKKANKKLKWKSSNKKYATVNSKGVVKTKKAGKGKKVKITARATDGSGKKATVKIKIK